MANIVLTAAVGSSYDDLPEVRYHFPNTYLNQVKAAEGDYAVYYEPRRSKGGGRQAYFAIVRIVKVVPDPVKPDHHYAVVDSYLEFAKAVPFKDGGGYAESCLQREDGKTSKGAFGRSVRPIPRAEFVAIVARGFERDLAPWEQLDQAPAGVTEDPIVYSARPRIEQWTAKSFREEAFRHKVREAYRNTCAISGLCLINGGGRPEVQAAHIRPVASDGPDSVRNGLALTGTIHWLFDRGLIGIDANFRVMTSPQGVPEGLSRLIPAGASLTVPEQPSQRPHPAFLEWHRDHIFKR